MGGEGPAKAAAEAAVGTTADSATVEPAARDARPGGSTVDDSARLVLGLLPVIGIPLPLISYGGSSLLVTLVAMGVLLNCAKTEPGARRARAAGRANRARGRVSRRS